MSGFDLGALIEQGISTLDEVVWGAEDEDEDEDEHEADPPIDYVVPGSQQQRRWQQQRERERQPRRTKKNAGKGVAQPRKSRRFQGTGPSKTKNHPTKEHQRRSGSTPTKIGSTATIGTPTTDVEDSSDDDANANNNNNNLPANTDEYRIGTNSICDSEYTPEAVPQRLSNKIAHYRTSRRKLSFQPQREEPAFPLGRPANPPRHVRNPPCSNSKTHSHNHKCVEELLGYRPRGSGSGNARDGPRDPSARPPHSLTVVRARPRNSRLDAGLGFCVLDVPGEQQQQQQQLLIVKSIHPSSIFADSDLGVGDSVLSINGIAQVPQRGGSERERQDQHQRKDEHHFRPSPKKARMAILASNPHHHKTHVVRIEYQKFGGGGSSSVGSSSRGRPRGLDKSAESGENDARVLGSAGHATPSAEAVATATATATVDPPQPSSLRQPRGPSSPWRKRMGVKRKDGGGASFRKEPETETAKPNQKSEPRGGPEEPQADQSNASPSGPGRLPEEAATPRASRLAKLRVKTQKLRTSGSQKIEASRKKKRWFGMGGTRQGSAAANAFLGACTGIACAPESIPVSSRGGSNDEHQHEHQHEYDDDSLREDEPGAGGSPSEPALYHGYELRRSGKHNHQQPQAQKQAQAPPQGDRGEPKSEAERKGYGYHEEQMELLNRRVVSKALSAAAGGNAKARETKNINNDDDDDESTTHDRSDEDDRYRYEEYRMARRSQESNISSANGDRAARYRASGNRPSSPGARALDRGEKRGGAAGALDPCERMAVRRIGGGAVSKEQHEELIRINRKVFDKLHARIDRLKQSNVQLANELRRARALEPEKEEQPDPNHPSETSWEEGVYKSQLELLQSRLEITTIQADKRQRELSASNELARSEHEFAVARLRKRISELEISNRRLALQQLEHCKPKEPKPQADTPNQRDPCDSARGGKDKVAAELQRWKDRNAFLEQKVASLEEKLSEIQKPEKQDQQFQHAGEGVEFPYEDTSFFQRKHGEGLPGGIGEGSAGSRESNSAVAAEIGASNSHNVDANESPEDLSESSRGNSGNRSNEEHSNKNLLLLDSSRESSNGENPGGEHDCKNLLDDTNDTESVELVCSGGIGIGRVPDEIAKRSSGGTSLRLVYEHDFEPTPLATAEAYNSVCGEHKTGSGIDHPHDASFESATSMVLIERILELESVLHERRDMTDPEKAGFVKALQYRIEKLTERGYERVDSNA
ncbi:unnamed protein product [Pseudo-nitzschia multistriata]|uniref:PDZ domain-containing protein n=1 Tax=Pseudo-nitzschia multistriata TaxID=183589 RepID=A0A448YWX4_9STRA|nr:unnamed protein product [Pseudo-nitzschia multistriata]